METFPSKNISISWVEKGSLSRNLSLSFGFAILTALSAQIRFELPFTPVPITAQTFVVILSGLLLGSKFGSLSMIFYLFTGLAGFPFFSGSVAGLAILKSPTIGYIVGFFIAAQIIGNMSQKPTIGIATGTFAIYTCGVIGLMITLNISPIEAVGIGVYPFIIGDLIKAGLAIGIAQKLK